MMLRQGMRVRIIKEGLLNGQEGNVNAVDGETVIVMLDEGSTVGVNMTEIQPLPQQPQQDPSQLVQVKLPDGVMVHVHGIPVETVLGIVKDAPGSSHAVAAASW
jgi:hypothetical protein